MPLSLWIFIAATTLSLEQPAPSEEQPEVTDATLLEASPMTWGAKDSWRWSIQGAWAKDVKHSDNTLQTYGVEFDYFMEDDLSLDFGFAYMDVQQDGPNANGFNFTTATTLALYTQRHMVHVSRRRSRLASNKRERSNGWLKI